MPQNVVDYITLLIALVAVAISIITFIKKRKSEQFGIALEINHKLEETVNDLIDISGKLNKNQLTDNDKKILLEEKRSKSLQYLNVLEFLSFMINNKEITNKNIKKYFRPSIVSESKQIFEDYSDIRKDKDSYEEIKLLLKEWDPSYHALHFELK